MYVAIVAACSGSPPQCSTFPSTCMCLVCDETVMKFALVLIHACVFVCDETVMRFALVLIHACVFVCNETLNEVCTGAYTCMRLCVQ